MKKFVVQVSFFCLLNLDLLVHFQRAELHHIFFSTLDIVTLSFIRSSVGVTAVSIGATITVQTPLQKGNGLHVPKLILRSRAYDVGIANSYSSLVGCHLLTETSDRCLS